MTIRTELFYIFDKDEQKLVLPIGYKKQEDASAKCFNEGMHQAKVMTGAELIAEGSTKFDAQGNLFA